MRKRPVVGPYRGPFPRVLGGSYGGGLFLMDEVPLNNTSQRPASDSTGKANVCIRRRRTLQWVFAYAPTVIRGRGGVAPYEPSTPAWLTDADLHGRSLA